MIENDAKQPKKRGKFGIMGIDLSQKARTKSLTSMNRKSLGDIIQAVLTSQMPKSSSKHLQAENQSLLIDLVRKASLIFSCEPALLKLTGDFVVVGDIHGDIGSLIRIFEKMKYPDQRSYLFLGDYVDRGQNSIEVIILLYALKILFPRKIYMIRGNHEFRGITSKNEFLNECLTYQSEDLYEEIIASFEELPMVAILNESILCVHGGVSGKENFDLVKKVKEDISVVHDINNIPDHMEIEILWNDPNPEITGLKPSNRILGHEFGSEIAKEVLNDYKYIIRSHQFCKEGFEFPFNDINVVTVFSSIDYCGLNNTAAVAIVSENEEIEFKIFTPLGPTQLKRRRIILPDFLLSANANAPILSFEFLKVNEILSNSLESALSMV